MKKDGGYKAGTPQGWPSDPTKLLNKDGQSSDEGKEPENKKPSTPAEPEDNSPLKKHVFPDRFAKLAIVPLRVSCAISK